MLDFRRTPCRDLWSTQNFRLLDTGVGRKGCGGCAPSVCDPILDALNRLSLSPESSDRQYTDNNSSVYHGYGAHSDYLGSCISIRGNVTDDYETNLHDGLPTSSSERQHTLYVPLVSYSTLPDTQLKSDNFGLFAQSPITCGAVHKPSYGNKNLVASVSNSNCEIPGGKHHTSPRDDGCGWHLRTETSQCCAWGDFSLRDAIGTALVILNSKSKPGCRRMTNRSHRNKEWDRDTLKLHSWFNAICLLEMPASLKQVFLSVRRKLEEDYVLCAFCRNNGESPDIYITHEIRDQDGRVTCPVLRVLSCPNCHATGDRAHTIRYCPHPRQF